MAKVAITISINDLCVTSKCIEKTAECELEWGMSAIVYIQLEHEAAVERAWHGTFVLVRLVFSPEFPRWRVVDVLSMIQSPIGACVKLDRVLEDLDPTLWAEYQGGLEIMLARWGREIDRSVDERSQSIESAITSMWQRVQPRIG